MIMAAAAAVVLVLVLVSVVVVMDIADGIICADAYLLCKVLPEIESHPSRIVLKCFNHHIPHCIFVTTCAGTSTTTSTTIARQWTHPAYATRSGDAFTSMKDRSRCRLTCTCAA